MPATVPGEAAAGRAVAEEEDEEEDEEEEEEEEEAGNEELELEPVARAARSEARSWPAASGRLQMKRRPSGAVIGMVRTPGT